MMDSDDDDIYPEDHDSNGRRGHDEYRMEDVDEAEEEGEEVEEDSDDEVNFITDAKEEPKQESGSQTKRQPAVLQAPADLRKSSVTPQSGHRGGSIPPRTQPARTLSPRPSSSQPPADDRPGTEYPARHTSKIDPNRNPVHPATGKPILSTDFDVDFPSESSKPWRKPGADITDYFNYGFDEFTWASYCLKQQAMPKEIKEINAQAEQMKAFVEGIPGGGAGGIPGFPGAAAVTGNANTNAAGGGANMNAGAAGGMPAMPGMPSETEMQQMFQTMMAQGMDPSAMDPNQFMSMMMGGVGMMGGQGQPPTGPQAGYAGGGGGGFDQGGSNSGGYGGGGGGGGGGNRGRGRGGRRNW